MTHAEARQLFLNSIYNSTDFKHLVAPINKKTKHQVTKRGSKSKLQTKIYEYISDRINK